MRQSSRLWQISATNNDVISTVGMDQFDIRHLLRHLQNKEGDSAESPQKTSALNF